MKKFFFDNNFRFRFILTNSLLAVLNYRADNNDRIAQIQETGCPFLKQADVEMMKSVLFQQKSKESSGAERIKLYKLKKSEDENFGKTDHVV